MSAPGRPRSGRVGQTGRWLLVAVVAALWLVPAQSALGHEERTAGDYTLVVGLIGEPFLQGPRFGFDFSITQAGRPVDGAEQTLQAEVSGAGMSRLLTIVARDEAGRYEAEFDPSGEASYELHLGGTLEGHPIDQTFTFHLVPSADLVGGGSPAQPVPAGAPPDGLPLLPIAAIGGLVIVGLGFALVVAGRRATTV